MQTEDKEGEQTDKCVFLVSFIVIFHTVVHLGVVHPNLNEDDLAIFR